MRQRGVSQQLLLEPAAQRFSSSPLPPPAPRNNAPDPSHCRPFLSQSERMMLVSHHGASAVRRYGQSIGKFIARPSTKWRAMEKNDRHDASLFPAWCAGHGYSLTGRCHFPPRPIPLPPCALPSLLSPLTFSAARRQGEPDAGRGASPLCHVCSSTWRRARRGRLSAKQGDRPAGRHAPKKKRLGTQTSPPSFSIERRYDRPAGRRWYIDLLASPRAMSVRRCRTSRIQEHTSPTLPKGQNE